MSETKSDNSFPAVQFSIPSYAQPCQRDQNDQGRGLFLYLGEYSYLKSLIINYLQSLKFSGCTQPTNSV